MSGEEKNKTYIMCLVLHAAIHTKV